MDAKEMLMELLDNTGYFINREVAGYVANNLLANGVVVREKGEWVDHGVRDWRCPKCGEKIKKVRNVDGYCYDDKPNFCPNCGSDMRKRDNDG